MVLPESNTEYTFADVLSWEDNSERYELYDGKIHALSPPLRSHNLVHLRLAGKMAGMFSPREWEVYARFNLFPYYKRGIQPKDIQSILQPDLMVTCNPTQIDDYGVYGAPNLIVEILSRSTRSKDLGEKFSIYQQIGVPEYWVIDPNNETVTVYTLKNGRYHRGGRTMYTADEMLPVSLVPGKEIDLSEIFPWHQKGNNNQGRSL